MTGEGRRASSWDLESLTREIRAALAGSDAGEGKLIDGRALAVKASPMRDNASKLVVGTAALPPGFSTPAHSHEAEEVALVLSGSGSVDIDGIAHRIVTGTVLLTPSNAVHVTHSDPGSEPLVILWLYAPPGSEARWVEPDKHSTAGHTG